MLSEEYMAMETVLERSDVFMAETVLLILE